MASNADGSVILDFSIDTDGLSREIDNANKSVERFAKKTNENLENVNLSLEESMKIAKKFKIEPTVEGTERALQQLDLLEAKIKNQEQLVAEYANQIHAAELTQRDYGEAFIALKDKMIKAEQTLVSLKDKQSDLGNRIAAVRSIMRNAEKETDNYGESIKNVGEKIEETSGKTEQLGESTEKSGASMKDTEKAIGSFQVALGNLISKGIEKTVNSLLNIADTTREIRKEMAMLEVNAESAGVGIEVAEQAMKELNVVADGTDSALEATSSLLASGFDENGLLDAVNALNGAAIKFSDTIKVESLAESLQETLAVKEATGQYAELLERLGVDLDSYNDAIKDMTDAQARDYSILILRNRGLEKQYLQYIANNEELKNAADAQWNYDMAMASLGEALEPIQSGIMQEITDLLSKNGDVVRAVAQNLADLAGIVLRIIAVLGSIPAPVWMVIATITTLVGTFITVYKTVKEVSNRFDIFGKGLAGFDMKALKTTAIIMGVIIVLLVLATVIAVIAGKSKDLENSMNSIGQAVGNIQGNVNNAQNGVRIPGYAKGTQSAGRGWRLVGEQGPELLYLRGGEKILTASQSMAWNAAYGGRIPDRAFNQTINLNVNGIEQMNEVVNWYTNRQQMARAR